ncbi:MAG: hypothetical protein WBH51_01405 [Mycolicibacter algericus]|uniref:phosphatase domain-containing protein n=1 Tax=Mycolicibacter algericus TaxID=1288388 RepID=UPI003C73303B
MKPKRIRSLYAPSGTRPPAVIVDIDGTLEDWNCLPHPETLKWVKRQHDAGRVVLIVTARDHETDYKRTHAWLKRHLHVPFVGPFCRSYDDLRYASEFKRAVYKQLSGLYEIVGAAEDNRHVIAMWKAQGLEVLETDYTRALTPSITSWSRPRRWSYPSGGYSSVPNVIPLTPAGKVDYDAIDDYYDQEEADPEPTGAGEELDWLMSGYDDWEARETRERTRCRYCDDPEWDPGSQLCALHWDEYSGR